MGVYGGLIGCWWVPFKWLFLTVPALLAKLFIPNRQKAVNKTIRKAVCQNCGNMWTFSNADMKREINNQKAITQVPVDTPIVSSVDVVHSSQTIENQSPSTIINEGENTQSNFSSSNNLINGTRSNNTSDQNTIRDYFGESKVFCERPVN